MGRACLAENSENRQDTGNGVRPEQGSEVGNRELAVGGDGLLEIMAKGTVEVVLGPALGAEGAEQRREDARGVVAGEDVEGAVAARGEEPGDEMRERGARRRLNELGCGSVLDRRVGILEPCDRRCLEGLLDGTTPTRAVITNRLKLAAGMAELDGDGARKGHFELWRCWQEGASSVVGAEDMGMDELVELGENRAAGEGWVTAIERFADIGQGEGVNAFGKLTGTGDGDEKRGELGMSQGWTSTFGWGRWTMPTELTGA